MRPVIQTAILFLAVFLVSPATLRAQTVTFAGHVTEQSTGQPLSGVAIVAEGDQTGTRVAISDAQGNYTFPFGTNTDILLRAYKTYYLFNPISVHIFSLGGFPIIGPFTKDFAGSIFPFLVI